MLRLALVLSLCALPTVHAQDSQPDGADTEVAAKPGIEVLQAIVMEVEGTAQARADRNAKWQKLKVNDALAPGTVIRTGRKSHVALRIGKNASVLIERQSRVAIPEIVQDGAVLRTRVSMSIGRAQMRVDRVGVDNDFEVATPTATLAVRGTTLLVTWDAVRGFRAIGWYSNRLRAIEVAYLSGVEAELSGLDGTSDSYPLPAIRSFYLTYIKPLIGSISRDEIHGLIQGIADRTGNPRLQSLAAKIALKVIRNKKTSIGSSPPSGGDEQ